MQDPKREAEEIVAEHARVGMNADRFRALIGAIEESLVNARSRGRAEGLREAHGAIPEYEESLRAPSDHPENIKITWRNHGLAAARAAISALLGEKPDRDAK